MVGPDIKVTAFAGALTTATCVSFWVAVCPHLPALACIGHVILFLMTMGFMVATATIDPGILPPNTSMDDATAASNAQASRFQEINGASHCGVATCSVGVALSHPQFPKLSPRGPDASCHNCFSPSCHRCCRRRCRKVQALSLHLAAMAAATSPLRSIAGAPIPTPQSQPPAQPFAVLMSSYFLAQHCLLGFLSFLL